MTKKCCKKSTKQKRKTIRGNQEKEKTERLRRGKTNDSIKENSFSQVTTTAAKKNYHKRIPLNFSSVCNITKKKDE